MKLNRSTYILVILVAWLPFIIAAWDNDKPGDNDYWDVAAGQIRDNWDAVEVVLGIDLLDAHPYYQASAPTKKPDGSTDIDANDLGRIWIDSDNDEIFVLTAATPTWSPVSFVVSSTDPAILNVINTTASDADEARRARFAGKGTQSGSELTTLGMLEFHHDGSGDDEKGELEILINDGDDADAPSLSLAKFSSDGTVTLADSSQLLTSAAPTADADIANKKYVDDQITATMTPPAYTTEESITFGNGLIFKRGSGSYASGATVSFSSADFPTAIQNVLTTVESTDGSYNSTVGTLQVDDFLIYHDGGGSQTIHWLAIGY